MYSLSFLPVFFLLFFFLLFFLKKRSRFWSAQPVFHIYDLYWYLFPCGIIDAREPEKNKYCNFADVEFLAFHDAEAFQIDAVVRLLQNDYFHDKPRQTRFFPQKENVVPYFVGHHASCFLSFFYDKRPLQDPIKNQILDTRQITGLMISRPVHLTLQKQKESPVEFDAYYVDYLCVATHSRKRGVAPQLIQTHEYWQRRQKKPHIPISLFKREGDLTGIVPLCVYQTYCFPVKPTIQISDYKYKIVQIGDKNMVPLYDFMKTNAAKFVMVGQSHMANWMELIKTGNWLVFLGIRDGVPMAAYFFRKTCVQKDQGEIVHCFASVKKTSASDFVTGFDQCIHKIATSFVYVSIEDMADNHEILRVWKKRMPGEYDTSPTAYFFYNFVHPSVAPQDILFLF